MASSGREWADLARCAEDLGYSTFQVADHLGDQFAAVPAIMAAACATESIEVGPLVAAVDLRNPVMLAKEAATIDLLSDGRFLMGVGAGWSEEDYAIGGIPQASAGIRLDRMVEAVQIMRGFWGEASFSFQGEHYSVAEVDSVPKPASKIPILIGGGGKKVLTLAARHADIVSINPKVVGRKFDSRSLGTAVEELVDERVGWIKDAAGSVSGNSSCRCMSSGRRLPTMQSQLLRISPVVLGFLRKLFSQGRTSRWAAWIELQRIFSRCESDGESATLRSSRMQRQKWPRSLQSLQAYKALAWRDRNRVTRSLKRYPLMFSWPCARGAPARMVGSWRGI